MISIPNLPKVSPIGCPTDWRECAESDLLWWKYTEEELFVLAIAGELSKAHYTNNKN